MRSGQGRRHRDERIHLKGFGKSDRLFEGLDKSRIEYSSGHGTSGQSFSLRYYRFSHCSIVVEEGMRNDRESARIDCENWDDRAELHRLASQPQSLWV
jgi:hypothetical protein